MLGDQRQHSKLKSPFSRPLNCFKECNLSFIARLRAVLSCLLLAVATSVNGELVLTNFTPAHPLKIMALGDSITDDCSTNGAWRRFLQPLLETNGYPFTFVGRVMSIADSGFTKTSHEGYCGAVIASPGVNNPGHGYTQADNYLQLIAYDTLTNTTPDLILLLIGANDIGKGRNPYTVATNDMPNLLYLIFSNAPNVNVILSKITTLRNAIGGYGTYAANVPNYNAALQMMVNQRRAQGQNVFLADMFSVVDYNTMFTTDHLHPNAAGLQAMAGEWLARIQAITLRTNIVTSTIISGGANWRYNDTGQDLGTNWSQADYDDSDWSNGPARLGYGDPEAVTIVSYGPDGYNRYPTTYFRRTFVAPENILFTNLNFRLARKEGAVVYLNGQEAFRVNVPAGTITHTTLASGLMDIFTQYIFYATNLTLINPSPGTNLVAVEVHKFAPAIPTFGFDMELIGAGFFVITNPPILSVALGPTNGISLSWSSWASGYRLETTTNLGMAGGWSTVLTVTNNMSCVTLPAFDQVRFFRLHQF
jgi:lysophospholipase L1-like esterase